MCSFMNLAQLGAQHFDQRAQHNLICYAQLRAQLLTPFAKLNVFNLIC